MRCVHIPGLGIVCGGRPQRPPCSVPRCRRRATASCDQPIDGGRGTCDDDVCDLHRVNIGPGLDLCLRHAQARNALP
jgi:hypothetical protein